MSVAQPQLGNRLSNQPTMDPNHLRILEGLTGDPLRMLALCSIAVSETPMSEAEIHHFLSKAMLNTNTVSPLKPHHINIALGAFSRGSGLQIATKGNNDEVGYFVSDDIMRHKILAVGGILMHQSLKPGPKLPHIFGTQQTRVGQWPATYRFNLLRSFVESDEDHPITSKELVEKRGYERRHLVTVIGTMTSRGILRAGSQAELEAGSISLIPERRSARRRLSAEMLAIYNASQASFSEASIEPKEVTLESFLRKVASESEIIVEDLWQALANEMRSDRVRFIKRVDNDTPWPDWELTTAARPKVTAIVEGIKAVDANTTAAEASAKFVRETILPSPYNVSLLVRQALGDKK